MSKVQKHPGQTADLIFSGRDLQKELNFVMECPHCNEEIPGRQCAECGTTVPSESLYCMNCGMKLEEEAEDTVTQEDAFDLENRILCPDGVCTGIMVDGKCTECGKTYQEAGSEEEEGN